MAAARSHRGLDLAPSARGRGYAGRHAPARTRLYALASRLVREAEQTKDKSYRKFLIGQEWGRFLRAKRLAGCRPNTLLSYETVGRLFALRYADFDSLEPFAGLEGPELILDFLERNWGDSDSDTLDQRTAVMRSFFEWAYRNDRISSDPMRKIEKRRRKRGGARRARVPEGPLARLIGGPHSDRDHCGLLLLGKLALRREDLRMLQIGDVDLGRDEIHLRHSKGGEEHVLPITFPELRDALYLHIQAENRQPLEYLIYPKSDRTRPMSPAGIAQWFNRCCERAGVVGYTMHQLRHAAADDFYAAGAGKDGAQMLLRHKDSETTEEYLHRSASDDLRLIILRTVNLEAEDGSGV